MPAGVFAMLNHARRHGFAVSAINEAVELALDPHFDTARYLARHPAQVYALDLHWHEHAHGALSLAQLIKERHPDAVVVLGGITASRFADEILRDHPAVDYVVSGYGEEPLLQLLQGLRRRVAPARRSMLPAAAPLRLDDYDEIDRTALLHAREYAMAQIHGLRTDGGSPGVYYRNGVGCFRSCSYCGGAASAHAEVFGHRQPLRRSPALVAADLAQLTAQGIGWVSLTHDVSSGRPDYWRELFDEVRASRARLGVYLEANGLPSAGFVRELARTFVPADTRIAITPLCGDDGQRALNGKGFGVRRLRACLRTIKAAGLGLVLYFAEGLPGPVPGGRVRALMLKAQLEAEFKPQMSVITPLTLDPGSPMQRRPDVFGVTVRLRTLADYLARTEARSEGRPFDDQGYDARPLGRTP
jgi:clorobiocin biosynthesis protein CloN6